MNKLEKQLLDMLDKSIQESTESSISTCCFKLFNRKPRSQKLAEFKLKIKLCRDDNEIIQAVISQTGSHYNYHQDGSTKMLIQDMLLAAHGYTTKTISQFLMDSSSVLEKINAAYTVQVSQVPNYYHGREIYKILMPLSLFQIIEAKKLLYRDITKNSIHSTDTLCKMGVS